MCSRSAPSYNFFSFVCLILKPKGVRGAIGKPPFIERKMKMNLSDILILLAVGIAVVLAVLRIRKRKKEGKGSCGCGCSCEGCNLCNRKP